MSCGVALIALGVGYLVYLNAAKEKEGLKLLGQVIGVVIMVGAVVSSLCMAKCKMMGGACPMSSGKAMMCPVSAGAAGHAQE